MCKQIHNNTVTKDQRITKVCYNSHRIRGISFRLITSRNIRNGYLKHVKYMGREKRIPSLCPTGLCACPRCTAVLAVRFAEKIQSRRRRFSPARPFESRKTQDISPRLRGWRCCTRRRRGGSLKNAKHHRHIYTEKHKNGTRPTSLHVSREMRNGARNG